MLFLGPLSPQNITFNPGNEEIRVSWILSDSFVDKIDVRLFENGNSINQVSVTKLLRFQNKRLKQSFTGFFQ